MIVNGIHLREASNTNEYAYRFEAYHERITVHHCKVVRHTPKGFVVNGCDGKEHQIYHGARKRYACLSLEDARDCFIARRKRRIILLTHQLQHTRETLAQIDYTFIEHAKDRKRTVEARGVVLENKILESANAS